jgi:RHS repeat-associated protein
LISKRNQTILSSSGKPLEECRIKISKKETADAEGRGLIVHAPKSASRLHGGGALSAMSETLAADHLTGAARFAFPLPVTPFRGAEPALELAYSSASGNGIFGLGFDLGIPQITRRTDIGTPCYDDTDRFILSGFGEIVLVRDKAGTGWVPRPTRPGSYRGVDYVVRDYRAREETEFALIEYWTGAPGQTDQPASFWKVRYRDNRVQIYGRRKAAREADPLDATRVFAWMLQESTDARGNQRRYSYVPDGSTGDGVARLHIDRVQYGAYTNPSGSKAWHFDLRFDYSGTPLQAFADANAPLSTRRTRRKDLFQTYTAGFGQRTSRLCTAVLLYHRFDDAAAFLVEALTLGYTPTRRVSHLTSLTLSGIRVDGKNKPAIRSHPTITLGYAAPQPVNAYQPLTVQTSATQQRALGDDIDQIVDLHREGLPGLILAKGGVLHYARPRGKGVFDPPEPLGRLPVALAEGLDALELSSLDADGRLDLIDHTPGRRGYYPLQEGKIGAFVQFEAYPNTTGHSAAHRADMTGDGKIDVVVFARSGALIYPSEGGRGFGRTVIKGPPLPTDFPMTRAPAPNTYVGFADLIGDGGAHVVEISATQINLWPSYGRGHYGTRRDLTLTAPLGPGFSPDRLIFADCDGLGPQDILYRDHTGLWLLPNLSGQGFGKKRKITLPNGIGATDQLRMADILGTGTTSLIASMATPAGARRHMTCDLSGGQKPHLLTSINTGSGLKRLIAYTPSTTFYLAGKAQGRRDARHPPSPIQTVSSITVSDLVTDEHTHTRLSYHQGYFCHVDRKFQGFELIELRDTAAPHDAQHIDAATDQGPSLTREWHHVGAPPTGEALSPDLLDPARDPYFRGYDGGQNFGALESCQSQSVPDALKHATPLIAALRRALSGQLLRSETYASDTYTPGVSVPVALRLAAQTVRVEQLGDAPHDHAFHTYAANSVRVHIDETPDQARITQRIILEVDADGLIVQRAGLYYPNADPQHDAQAVGKGLVTTNGFFDPVINDAVLLGRLPKDSVSADIMALEGLHPKTIWTIAALRKHLGTDGHLGAPLEKTRHWYYATDGTLFGQTDAPLAPQGLFARSDVAVWPQDIAPAHLAERFTHARLRDTAGLTLEGGYWWRPGEAVQYDMRPGFGFQIIARAPPIGTPTQYHFDPEGLFMTAVRLGDGSTETLDTDLYQLMPWRHVDFNATVTEVRFDPLGEAEATTRYNLNASRHEGDARLDSVDAIPPLTPDTAATDPRIPVSSVHYYNLAFDEKTGEPPWTLDIHRTQSLHLDPDLATPCSVAIAYHNGHGAVLQIKDRVDAGLAFLRRDGTVKRDAKGKPIEEWTDTRWRSTGWIKRNNKGAAVEQFDPFYSPSATYEDDDILRSFGAARQLHRDPIGRVIRINEPSGTFTRETFAPWHHIHENEHDTLRESDRFAHRTNPDLVPPNEVALLERRALVPPFPEHTVYDVLGQICHSLDHADAKTPIGSWAEHNVLGRLIAAGHDDHDPACEHLYDMAGNVVWSRYADAVETWTLHDAAGAVALSWDSADTLITRHFDGMHRHVASTLETADDADAQQIVYVVYAPATPENQALYRVGRIAEEYNEAGQWTFARYDLCGLPAETHVALTVGDTGADPVPWSETVTFDAIGRTLRQDLSTGISITQTYGREHSVTSLTLDIAGHAPIPILRDAAYTARGAPISQRLGTGVERIFHHDLLTGNLIGLESQSSSTGLSFQRDSFVFDPVGSIAEIHDIDGATTSYSYDALSRLLSEDSATETRTFEHDSRGNLLSETVTRDGQVSNRANTYDTGSNRLLVSTIDGTATRIGYDLRGNMTALGDNRFTWDHSDRLSQVQLGQGSQVYNLYDTRNEQRVQIVEDAEKNRVTRRFFYGDYDIEHTYPAPGEPSTERHRVYLRHQDDDPAAVLQFTLTNGRITDSVVRLLIGDHLGSPVFDTGLDGSDPTARRFAPFGAQTPPPTEDDSSLGYSAKRRDAPTGLLNFGQRYFAPEIGRWISPDPSGTQDGLNLYQFVGGDPVNWTDTDGLSGKGKSHARKPKKKRAHKVAPAPMSHAEVENLVKIEARTKLGATYSQRRGGVSAEDVDWGRGRTIKRAAAMDRGVWGALKRGLVSCVPCINPQAKEKMQVIGRAVQTHHASLPKEHHSAMAKATVAGVGSKVLKIGAKAVKYTPASAAATPASTLAYGLQKVQGHYLGKARDMVDGDTAMDNSYRFALDHKIEHLDQGLGGKAAEAASAYVNDEATSSEVVNAVSYAAVMGIAEDAHFAPSANIPEMDRDAAMTSLVRGHEAFGGAPAEERTKAQGGLLRRFRRKEEHNQHKHKNKSKSPSGH